MTTAYTSLLGLALPVTGELSGTWGDTVNNSITSLLDTSVAGTTNVSTDTDVTLTTTTGAANTARQAILLFSGARTALRTVTAPAQSKIYTVINATTGGFSVKLVGAGPTTGVTIVAGESAVCAWNGSDFIKISNTGGSASFTNVTVTGTTTLSGLTASTALALDASKNVVSVTNTGTGNNVLSASPTLTGTVAGASLSLSSLTSGRVTYATTAGLLTDSANLTFNGTTLTANTIGAFTLGGTIAGGGNQINNVIIGTSTPLAGSFTTLSATTTIAAGGAIKSTGANLVNEASAVKLSQETTAISRVSAYGNDASTQGSLQIRTISSDGTASAVPALFSSTGLAVTGSLTATGDVIGGNGSTQARLIANSSAAQFSDVLYQTAGVNRWAIEKTGAEGGSNAGGDLYFYRYTDAGGYLGNPLTITRSTGLVTANSGLTVVGQSFFGASGAYVSVGSPKITVYGAGATETSMLWFEAGIGSTLAGFKANDPNFYITNTYNGNALGTNGIAIGQNGYSVVTSNTVATNTGDQNVVVVAATTSGAYAASYGAGLQFQITNSSGGYSGSRIVSRLNADNNTANLVFQARNYGFSDSMVLDSNGKLGLGETSPGTYGKLVVRNDTASGAGSSGSSTIWLLNTNTTANNASTIYFGNNATAAAGGINFVNTDHTLDYGQISFDTNGASGYGTRLTINQNGYLLLGSATANNYLNFPAASNASGISWENYGNVFGEFSSGATYLSSNYYPTPGAAGYKTTVTATYGAAGISINGTGGTSNSGIIQFFVNSATAKTAGAAFTPTEVACFTPNGLGLGGATPSSGIGITFPASQSASSNANTLDDYEEGTWTPTFTFASGSATYSNQTGSYVKVGSAITVSALIILANLSTASGAVSMTLPFACKSGSTYYWTVSYASNNITWASSSYGISAQIGNGQSVLNFYNQINGGSKTVLAASQFTSSTELIFTCVYQTD